MIFATSEVTVKAGMPASGDGWNGGFNADGGAGDDIIVGTGYLVGGAGNDIIFLDDVETDGGYSIGDVDAGDGDDIIFGGGDTKRGADTL